MVDLIPKSYATTENLPPGTVYAEAVVTSETRSTPAVPRSARAAASNVAPSAVPKAPRSEPASRRMRVRRRVSRPAMPGSPFALSMASRSSVARQLLRRRASSRTMTPRANVPRDSLSAAVVP